MLHDHLETFGELLHTMRKRAGLTQQRLADAIGMHRHEIGRWEQGVVLPASRTIVLELARHLHLDEQEARSLLNASLTAPTPLWSVPLPRNPFFTGREAVLQALHISLNAKQTRADAPSLALQGLGGIGKTQSAVEYAYRHALTYHAVFWIEAETTERVFASLQRIAELLHLPERTAENQQQMVEAIQRWLTTHDQWLLIWDNLEDLELPYRLLLPGRQGTFLLTTRQQALGTLARGIDLQPMEQEEALLLLLRRAKVLGPEETSEQVQGLALRRPGEYAAAGELVTRLGGLPLALDQAGAYIEETGCTLSDYLQHYERQQTCLLARRGGPGSDHPQSVTTTFQLSQQRIEQKQQTAADLLRICAFLHAEAIPEELLQKGSIHLGPTLASLDDDPLSFDLALATLRDLSLIQRYAETRTLALHRLVQAVVRGQMEAAEERLWIERVVCMLHAIFPVEDVMTWSECERYLPQVLACVPLIESTNNTSLEAMELLAKAGSYLMRRGRLEEAEPLITRSVCLCKLQSRPEGATHLLPLTVEAELCWQQGKFALAEERLQHVLNLEEHVLEPTDPRIANTLTLLARYTWEQGKYEQAALLYQSAGHIWEQQPCPDHPDNAFRLHHQALLYWKQGQYEQALHLCQHAIRIFEKIVGPGHPHIAIVLLGLAALYGELGDDTQARQILQRILFINEQTLEPDHPNLAFALNGLASLDADQGNYAQAEQLYQRALQIREQALGPDHPEVSYTLSGMAKLSFYQGNYAHAEALFQRALYIREHALEAGHPDIASLYNNMATLYRDQGDYSKSELLYRQALSLREQLLGLSHIKVARTLVGLACLYEKQGKEEQAEALLQRAYSIFAQHLPQKHPEVLRARDMYRALSEKNKRQ